MKKNINITNMPSVKVLAYTKPAPQTPKEIAINAIPTIAVTAATTAVAGLVGALVNRITRPRAPKHVPVQQVHQILDESADQ